jgi:hypothetical protein
VNGQGWSTVGWIVGAESLDVGVADAARLDHVPAWAGQGVLAPIWSLTKVHAEHVDCQVQTIAPPLLVALERINAARAQDRGPLPLEMAHLEVSGDR